MARTTRKTTPSRRTKTTPAAQRVTVERSSEDQSFFEKFQTDLQKNQSYLNLILGSLIVIVLGVLLFNYFNKPTGNIGPSENTQNQNTNQTADVSKDNLPGNYTVKEGDTLFTIAQKYYDDGNKYTQIMEANKLTNENMISSGQVLMIPKLPTSSATTGQSSTPSASPASEQTTQKQTTNPVPSNEKGAQPGTGGAINQTIWGEKINGTIYTVQPGDWLSKISGRAYGDIFQFEKIAQANNIKDPNVIEPGTVLKIPR